MNTLRKSWLMVVFAALVTILPAQADVTWKSVKDKINNNQNYSVIYEYEGPSGIYDFNYKYTGGDIRTEITDSKSDPTRRGTVIMYKKGGKQVIANSGGGTIARDLNHKDVVGRPFHQSLYGMILAQVKSLGEPKAFDYKGGKKFVFPGDYTIWANANSEIVKTQRKDGRTPEIREFKNHAWK